MGQPIDLQPDGIEQAAEQIAGTISQAAQPGPVPTATPGSPADTAAATVASAVIQKVAAASAELAPKSAEGLALTQAGLAGAQTKDTDNAAQIQSVADDPQTGSGGVLSV